MQYTDGRNVRSAAVLLFIQIVYATVGQEWDICKERSCYPATGNLLIGREHRLSSTSTCGLVKTDRYCIVSHLEDKKKCFVCDSRKPWARYTNERSHRIENVVSERYEMRSKRWWQSAKGQQNVSVRLDLEAEFHFTHLIMTFKSFRPAAMLIERSSDFGRTWKTYRYFAYDCAESFPGVYEGMPRRHTDVVCDSRYSFVAPSTGGEVVFKVLSPHIELEDPYSEQIQDLLRVTNLRINFTKLHTLGDNLLDNRPEITEKYYYAIYEMVVRGSCSCYGHARRCIPIQEGDDEENNYVAAAPMAARPDMVYGRCECAHHTKGLNCEECEDFYNDLPWKPAIDRETNACKKCNCNQHAARCHFDHAVFEASGYVSGGVCDDCQHNTMGKNCETCKPYYHRDSERDMGDPYVCRPCECDLRGSLNQGICDSETDPERNLLSGRCHCKVNVMGDRCDQCKNGFWNLDDDNPDGCTPCSCHLLGTMDNQGCHKRTGECTCKRLVTGDNCDQCLPEHYGLSEEPAGCKPCDCDLGGARHNQCDLTNGQCVCRPHFAGRRCDQPESGHYCANLDFFTYEAELAKLDGPADVEPRQLPADNVRPGWTGAGLVRVREGSVLGMVVNDIRLPMDYHVMVRYESAMPAAWQDVRVDVIRPSPPHPDGPCANSMPKDDLLNFTLHPTAAGAATSYYVSPSTVCLEPNVQYHVRLSFGAYGQAERGASLLVDSLVLVPGLNSIDVLSTQSEDGVYKRRQYEHYRCRELALRLSPVDELPETCRRLLCPVAASLLDQGVRCDCDPTGSVSGICQPLAGQCRCKLNVIGRRCDQCAPGTFGFGPQGCTACDCDSIGALDNLCDQKSGQCKCRDGVYGRQCDQCQPGFWGFPECRQCQCNGHADVCDQRTGACIECRDLANGHHCEVCQDGYYGDPRIGINIPCRPCPCPGGPGSGFQHADTCYLDRSTETVLCNCRHGYEGERCDRCILNYWGNPNEVGGSCERCDCNGNIDLDVANSCDPKTGRCLKCIFNTDGYQCEHCMAGFFGDARTQSCEKCVCNMLGTDVTAGPCDRVSGQCPCLGHVVGLQCDTCAANHWKIASGTGCEPCQCDLNGVLHNDTANGGDGQPMLQCNEFDGQCPCKPGRGGRTCSQCEDYYWGDPATECQRCQCNPLGSATLQCHRANGSCECTAGSGGFNCDQCARGYTGTWPNCEPCGECFSQWDAALQALKAETDQLHYNASNVADSGATFAYDDELKRVDGKLAAVRRLLDVGNVSADTVDELKAQCRRLDSYVEHVTARLNAVDSRSTGLTASVDKAEQHLQTLSDQVAQLRQTVDQLELNVTRLRETDAQGAYNVTREAAQVSLQAQQRADASERMIGESEAERRRTKQLLDANAQDFEQQFRQNQDAMDSLQQRTAELLEARLPDMNLLVCGARTAGCDELCGGAGCQGRCGGPSCRQGAVTKSEQAVQFSKEALDKLELKQQRANQLVDRLRHAQLDSQSALADARQAYETAVRVAQVAEDAKTSLAGLLQRANGFVQGDGATPEQIRALAERVMNMTISLDKQHIQSLARDIGASLNKLTTIEHILADTRANITVAQQLKSRADQAKVRIEAVERAAQEVVNALNDSRHYQAVAKQAVQSARDNFQTAQDDLQTIGQLTAKTHDVVQSCQRSVVDLKDGLKQVDVEYLQIGKDVERSLAVSNASRAKLHDVDELRKMVDDRHAEAEALLQQKTGHSDAARQRAEQLRQTATKLLEKTEKHLADIEELRKIVVVNEVTANQVDGRLTALLDAVEHADQGIQHYLKEYERCSCVDRAGGDSDGSCPLL